MATLIDSTYFTGLIAVPTSKYGNDIQDYIDRYEEVILTDLLGYSLYVDFIDGLSEPSPDQKWLDLRDGKIYEIEYNGETRKVKWDGLVNAAKESLIAYYVFCRYKEDNQTITTNIGGVDPDAENAKRVIESDKFVESWRRLMDLYGQKTDSELKPTAYNFLKEFEDDYSNWEFSDKGRINTFDI